MATCRRDEPRPTTEELSRVLDTLTGTLQKARKQLTDRGGVIAMSRLNRREYANSIRDLFGFDVRRDMIPEHNESAGFDTVGADQFFRSSRFEKYLKLGRVIATSGFDWTAKPHRETTASRQEPEEHVTHRLRNLLADLDHKVALTKADKTWREMGFTDQVKLRSLLAGSKTAPVGLVTIEHLHRSRDFRRSFGRRRCACLARGSLTYSTLASSRATVIAGTTSGK